MYHAEFPPRLRGEEAECVSDLADALAEGAKTVRKMAAAGVQFDLDPLREDDPYIVIFTDSAKVAKKYGMHKVVPACFADD